VGKVALMGKRESHIGGKTIEKMLIRKTKM
jgi:hypothetical protein